VEIDAPGSLRFRLLGFPVAINWSVLFVGALVIGSELPAAAILLFFPVAILSILIHELGHAVAARSFGGRVESVFLYLMGGLTSWSPGLRPITGVRRFIISAAGSGVEISFGLAVFAMMKLGVFGDAGVHLMNHPFDTWFWQAGYVREYAAYAAGVFVWMSVFWGVLNWVPIGGLDGSHMVREIAVHRNPLRGEEIARGISIVASVAAFLYLYSQGYRLFAFLVVVWALPSLSDSRGLA